MIILNKKRITLVITSIFLSIFIFIFTADNIQTREKYTPTVSLPVSGKTIVVDAGHGGNDPGAVSGSLREKDLNLQAANYMYNRFKELGVPVISLDDLNDMIGR